MEKGLGKAESGGSSVAEITLCGMNKGDQEGWRGVMNEGGIT